MRYLVPPQIFKGYVVRNLEYETSRYGAIPSYELNIAIPEGLSGAPLMLMNSTIVIDVVYGSHSITTIEELKLEK